MRRDVVLFGEIRATSPDSVIGGYEFAGNIVENLDVARAAKKDPSFARFIGDLRSELNRWVSGSR